MSISVSDLNNILNSQQGVNMITASPTSALQNEFMQTPAYQLAYGNNTITDPSLRFLMDPGTQLAINAGMPSLLNNFATKGLGQSGALAQALANNMYGQYGNYIGTQENMFSNYQNQLNNLTQFGAANSGAQNAYNSGTTLANLISNANLSTGQSLANANLGTASSLANANLGTAGAISNANLGSYQGIAQSQLGVGGDLASLLASQGSFNANAILNTAAAQSNNLFQGLALNAQVGANQLASQAQTQGSAAGGQGAMAGAGYGGYGSGGSSGSAF